MDKKKQFKNDKRPLRQELIKRTSIEHIYDQIKIMMYNQELVPGQKLVLRELAHHLKISTTPLLQTLHRLENARLVRYEQNKGFFVAEISVTETRELFQVREALEVYLVPFIIEKITEESIDKIRESFRVHRDSTKPNYRRKLLLTDASFHLTIAKTSGNQIFADLLKTTMERIYLKYRPEYLWEERADKVLKQHRELLDAFKKKDVELAKKITSEHIQSGMNNMISTLMSERLESLDF